jgi:hypothetical protein
MNRTTKNFYALLSILNEASAKPHSPSHAKSHSLSHAAATGIVNHEIIPIIAEIFGNYPQKNVDEVLDLCEPALIDVLARIIER